VDASAKIVLPSEEFINWDNVLIHFYETYDYEGDRSKDERERGRVLKAVGTAGTEIDYSRRERRL
jgi:hypothetical protein